MDFLSKINPFSAKFREMLQELSDSVDEYNREKDYLKALVHQPLPEIPNISMVRITDSRIAKGISGSPGDTDVAKNMFVYEWEGFGEGGDSQNFTHYALNAAELGNDASGQQSYGVSVSASSPAITLLSIGDSGNVEPVCLMMTLPAPMTQLAQLYNASTGVATGVIKLRTRHFIFAGNDVSVSC